MKNKLMPLMDKLLTRKRSIIETIIDQLKNFSQIEHSHPSQSGQFLSQLGLWIDCLLPSSSKAFSQYRCLFSPFCLTRTQENLFFVEQAGKPVLKNGARCEFFVAQVLLSLVSQFP